ncbi:flavodoxin family protein [Dehalococcoidia bacterium]|nr:flavodoxin family protein [Dehalococcoidia bacterium]
MRTLIVYASIHHRNTEKVAKAIGGILDAELVKPQQADITALPQYDLIGFGSGIYYGKHHKSLLGLVDKLPPLNNRKAFIFHTSGLRKMPVFHAFDKALRRKLAEKGFDIVGEFSCPGFDTYGPFELIGGIRKGRPNKKDLEKAETFARDLLRKLGANNNKSA